MWWNEVRSVGRSMACAIFAASPAVWIPHVSAQQSQPESVPKSGSEILHTLINLTEDLEARARCPLDTTAAQSAIQAGFNRRNLNAIYSPVADGQDVVTHELVALPAPLGTDIEPTETCLWQTTIMFRGTRHHASDAQFGGRYSSLEHLAGQIPLIVPIDVSPSR
jgi:hypothetical protein